MVLSLDLETTGLIGESKPKGEPETRITCIGILDDFGIRQFASPWNEWNTAPDRAERMLLQAFVDSRSLHDHGPILTYNGLGFDFPLLKLRCEVHGIKENFDGFPHVDQMPFTTNLNGARMKKDYAAGKYADIYVPKTTEAAYFARAYMYRLVTPQIQAKMLSHNAMDVATTWNYHHDMLLFPDYRDYVSKCLGRASGSVDGNVNSPPTPPPVPDETESKAKLESKKASDVEAFL